MVRQIRKCTICAKRFIALHSAHGQCGGCSSPNQAKKQQNERRKLVVPPTSPIVPHTAKRSLTNTAPSSNSLTRMMDVRSDRATESKQNDDDEDVHLHHGSQAKAPPKAAHHSVFPSPMNRTDHMTNDPIHRPLIHHKDHSTNSPSRSDLVYQDATSTTKSSTDHDDDDGIGKEEKKDPEQDETVEDGEDIQNPIVWDLCSEAEDENDSIHDDDDDNEDDEGLLLVDLLGSNPNNVPVKNGNDDQTKESKHDLPNQAETFFDAQLPMNQSSSNIDMTNSTICWICGTNLSTILQRSGRKGRVQHMKRCSKNHNVALQDLICPDENDQDEYLPDTTNHNPPGPTTSDPTSAAATILHPITANGGPKNPYADTKQNWHDNTTVVTTSTATSKDVNRVLMAGARRNAKIAEVQKMFNNNNNAKGNKRQRYQPAATTATTNAMTTTSSHHSCPKYKIIPGTDFVCDGFHYARTEFKTYFLTHFHSDHYGGITKHWNMGTIYCSVPTANLVHSQLGVPKKYIHPLPMDTPTIIAASTGPNHNNHRAVTVTLLNANHCPGAIMFLFEVGNRVILHVGDFRWNYQIMSHQPPLRPFCRIPWTDPRQQPVHLRRIDDLFLDTTYCDAQYTLPTQSECINAVIDVVHQEIVNAKSSKANIILLFGAYTIGKEAVYMSVAKHFKMKVFVDQRRYRILSSLEWSQEDISILTTNPELTNIWVVPLGHINMSKMSNYLTIQMKNFRRVYDRVIGFRPTGWTLQKKKGTTGRANTSVIGTTTKGFMTLHTVPYSEHSSFPELVECLESLNPKRIIPTVNASKSQQQIDLLMKHWRLKQEQLFLEQNA